MRTLALAESRRAGKENNVTSEEWTGMDMEGLGKGDTVSVRSPLAAVNSVHTDLVEDSVIPTGGSLQVMSLLAIETCGRGRLWGTATNMSYLRPYDILDDVWMSDYSS